MYDWNISSCILLTMCCYYLWQAWALVHQFSGILVESCLRFSSLGRSLMFGNVRDVSWFTVDCTFFQGGDIYSFKVSSQAIMSTDKVERPYVVCFLFFPNRCLYLSKVCLSALPFLTVCLWFLFRFFLRMNFVVLTSGFSTVWWSVVTFSLLNYPLLHYLVFQCAKGSTAMWPVRSIFGVYLSCDGCHRMSCLGLLYMIERSRLLF